MNPLWMRWNGAALIPTRPDLAEREFLVDGVYLMEAHQDRSYARHKAYFASLNEAWHSLASTEFPSVEHLRKFALIRTGWCDERVINCTSPVIAERLAAFCRPMDSYAIVAADGPLVRVWTAKSQNYRAMTKDDFNRSMDDVLGYVAGLLEVSKETLAEQGESA